MKPNNNLENQFRKKLNERTIQPSDQAWDRLDAMLEVAQKKKPKRAWLWTAAGLVGLATIGSLFLKTNKNDIILTEDFVIEENYKRGPLFIPEMWDDEEDFTISEKELNKKTVPQDSFWVAQKAEVFDDSNDRNIDNHKNIEEVAITNTKTEDDTEPNIYITAQGLLEHVEDEKYIAVQNKKTTITIDHKSLLYQAEKEVEERYRKKAIDRFIQKNLYNVGVALSNK